jgi:hypothetical protein
LTNHNGWEGLKLILGAQSMQVNETLSEFLEYFMRFSDFSVERNSTVDVDGLAGHRAGLFRAKEKGGVRDFFRGLRAAQQQAIQKAGQLLFFVHAHFFRERRA